ncbi:hypothetical protein LUW76_30315 [Actinomadura madurae]|uniref:hypothetical protein n=1 Tax=Actinomadura madurae TaxID=1993 RepID=UPI002026E08B|nr:hypothetical protein [Actinomadura madurae]URM98306.1 hypothetical protein LUW76_30315 [Actinomadura madurae]URN08996.1 hypothetical protein LUW74_40340 [Actinomadura madurae]
MPGIGLRAAMTALAVCLGGTVAACGGEARPAAETPTATPSTQETPYKTVGDNGQIRIVEKGFSTIRKDGDLTRLSYGIVFENLNPRAVAFPTLTVDFVDAQGKAVPDMVKRPVTDLRILPGSRYGLGSTLPFARPGQVADIKVEVTETTWTTDRSEGRFTALKAGGVRTQREFPSTRQATLRFGVDSGFTEPVPVMRVSALFRDRSGRIIGGADDLRQEESFKNVPPGRAQFQLVVGDGLPAGTADERTEIHVHPVLFPVG